MDWQQMASLAIVGITAALMLWSRFRRPKFSFARNTACGGCPAAGGTHRPPSVTFHVRRGERPQIIVKRD